MPELPPDALILAAPPGAPGVAQALAARPGRATQVLLVGDGLAWLASEALGALRAPGMDVALCSANARERGLVAERTPSGVRWSSVATWIAQLQGRPFTVLLP